MTNISHNIAQLHKQIHLAEQNCGRNAGEVLLLAVSKLQPVTAIERAFEAGQRDFGENYAQELEQKSAALRELNIIWHFIGPIQSNKTRIIAENCSWVHSIDRPKTAKRLNDQRPSHLPPLQVCIQVNIEQEDTKSGVAPENLGPLVKDLQNMPNLQLRGLMAIPSKHATISTFDEIAKLAKQYNLKTLSMGMSNDMETAIIGGSTIVRIGTALFGERRQPISVENTQ